VDSACVFCHIVGGSAEASFVHRDEMVSAFLDIRPVTPGHLLVIPNQHIVFSHDVPEATAGRMFAVARHLSRVIHGSDVVHADGVNLFVADGESAGQEVFHAHLHVIPRFDGDGFEISAGAWRDPAPTRDELERRAEAIRDAMG
jgi:histidine triad (HIT) family protein